jgi:hypothetical protein
MTQCAVTYSRHGTKLEFTGPIPNPRTMARKLFRFGFSFYPTMGPGYVADYWQLGYNLSPDDIQAFMPYVEVYVRNQEA